VTQDIFVWDIESVRDLRRFALANDLGSKSDEEVRQEFENQFPKFPKHIYHSIICIGALVIRAKSVQWKARGTPSGGGSLTSCVRSQAWMPPHREGQFMTLAV
jgi:hypothetical protein